MGQRIHCTVYRLISWKGFLHRWIHDGKSWIGVFGSPTPLLLLFLIGDDPAGVHLRARSRDGQHPIDGQGFLWVNLTLIKVPGISIIIVRRCRNLGGIQNRSSSHSHDGIHLLLFHEIHGLNDLGEHRIWFYAVHFHIFNAILFERVHHFVIDPILEDGSFSVQKQHLLVSIFFNMFSQIFDGSLSKDQPRGIVKIKIQHVIRPPLIYR